MSIKNSTEIINKRYSSLAEGSSCLSCGETLYYSKPQKGEVCVELGSGRGNEILHIANIVGEEGFAYGIDISDGMIKKSRENAEKLGVKNVEFIQTELHNLLLPNDKADLVVSNCTINHATDKMAVWQEIFRILKKGGRFVVSDIYSLEIVPEIYSSDQIALSECWAGAIPKDEYIEILNTSGFERINIIEESNPYKKGEIMISSFTHIGWKP